MTHPASSWYPTGSVPPYTIHRDPISIGKEAGKQREVLYDCWWHAYVASDHTAYFFVSLGLFSMAMRIYALNISYKPIILLSRTVNKSGHPLCYPLTCSPHSPHIPQPITTTSYTRPPPLVVNVEDAKKWFHILAVLCVGAWCQNNTAGLWNVYFDD